MAALSTPERFSAAAARPSPRSPAAEGSSGARIRDVIASVNMKLCCAVCKAPEHLFVDGAAFACASCASAEAVQAPSALIEALSELRGLHQELSLSDTSRPRVRAKRGGLALERHDGGGGFQSLNPNTFATPNKVSTSDSAPELPDLPPLQPVLDALSVTEERERDEVLTHEAQERVSAQKAYAVTLKQVKAAARESSRQFKAKGDKNYEAASYDAAVECYTRAIEINDGTASLSVVHGNRSAAFFMLQRWEQCVDDCNASLKHDDIKQPSSRSKICERGSKAALSQGDFPAAVDFLLAIPAAARSQDVELRLERLKQAAMQLQELPSRDQADRIDTLRMIVSEFSEATPLRIKLGELFVEAGEFHRALQMLDTLSSPSLDSERCKVRALYLQGFERVPDALRVLQSALMAEEDVQLRSLLDRITCMEKGKQNGNTHFAGGRYAESIEEYTAALTAAEGVPNIQKILYCNRAASFKELKRFKDGVSDCSAALAIDSKFAKAYTRRARCLLALECFDGACRDFKAAISLVSSAEEKRNLESEKNGVEKARRIVEDREKDLYHVLEVPVTATEREIKKQYKVLSLKWHPDKNMSSSEDEQRQAEHRFKKLTEAYGILGDEHKRREYDFKRQRAARVDPTATDFRSAHDAGRPRYNPPPNSWQRQPGKFW